MILIKIESLSKDPLPKSVSIRNFLAGTTSHYLSRHQSYVVFVCPRGASGFVGATHFRNCLRDLLIYS